MFLSIWFFIAIFLPKDRVGYLWQVLSIFYGLPLLLYFRVGRIHTFAEFSTLGEILPLVRTSSHGWIRILNLKISRLSLPVYHSYSTLRSPKTTNIPICRLYVVHNYRNYLFLRNLRFQFSPELVPFGNASCFRLSYSEYNCLVFTKDRNAFNPCLILCRYIVVSFSYQIDRL